MAAVLPSSAPSSGLAISRETSNRAVAAWLLACCVLVFAIIVVGGVTRLTHSGLSITEWQPIVGAIPPLSDADWQVAFAKYRATPEYQQVNKGMSLDAFKGIFWWEYAHRLLGRVIGVAFLIPFLWFALRRRIPRGYGKGLAVLFVLGGLQGALGWYMVKSGLVADPKVSPFRLTAHLALAFVIFGAMLWMALSLLLPDRVALYAPSARSARRWAFGIVALVFVMVVTGGFVAGIRAGFAYNTFPLMNGSLVPAEIFMLEPKWTNFFWNMATVQFDHRVGAWALFFLVPILWWKLRRAPNLPSRAEKGGDALLAMLAVQIALGIATLLLVVPLPLAALHQGGAVVLFGLAINIAHSLR
ncbi:MAG TPA: COX15/CtaA family protein [Casimicrobiaceae bacterium]|nr:COX15/CtaA family protein [Casimicrobiaceae bacterium]